MFLLGSTYTNSDIVSTSMTREAMGKPDKGSLSYMTAKRKPLLKHIHICDIFRVDLSRLRILFPVHFIVSLVALHDPATGISSASPEPLMGGG